MYQRLKLTEPNQRIHSLHLLCQLSWGNFDQDPGSQQSILHLKQRLARGNLDLRWLEHCRNFLKLKFSSW